MISVVIQVNLDMTDSTGPGKLVRHVQNPSYTYDTYLICMGLGPSILSVIDKSLSYSGPSYPSSPVFCREYANDNVLISPIKVKRLFFRRGKQLPFNSFYKEKKS